MQRIPRDRLTKPGRPIGEYGSGPGLPAPPPDAGAAPYSIGLERTTAILFGAPATQGALGVYGPVTVLETPANVERIEIRRLAVQGSPEDFFNARCWWFIGTAGGAAQELQAFSQLVNQAGGALVDPALRAGVSWTPYGSLEDPQPVAIELTEGKAFQIGILSASTATVGLSVYVRASGMIYYRRGL